MMQKIILGDCSSCLYDLEENSVDLCLTDPPYFLDKLDDSWDVTTVNNKNNMKVVTSLPSGMRYDKTQGKKFKEWYKKISEAIFRVLKPGAYFFSFSAPRLYHNMASGVEEAGFDIRDQFIWLYTQNQPKAMSLNHVIDRLKISEEEKLQLKNELSGWKTPQVKSCHEPILMAQKPIDLSFLDNYRKHKIGLVNTEVKMGEQMFPSNVVSTEEFDDVIDRYFLVPKPNKQEKGNFNFHKTVKALDVCKYIIALTTREKDVVIDPFLGSGTTCVAAKQLNRNYIGIELNKEYFDIANKRLYDD